MRDSDTNSPANLGAKITGDIEMKHDIEIDKIDWQDDEQAPPVERLVMFELDDQNKRLILHAAYFAVAQDKWRHHVFTTVTDRDEKKAIIGKMPCGDPMNNLLNLAERLLPNFDGNAPINDEVEKIKTFIYGT